MKKNNYYQKVENNHFESTIHFSSLNPAPGALTHSRNSSTIKTFIIAGILVISINQVLAQKQHPYLFYTPQRVNHLKERIKTDTLIATNWNALKQRCDNWLQQSAGGNMEQLALAYNVTKDDRYAARAKALLMELVNKKEWDGMDDRTPRWNAGLGTSHTNWTASVTFDAIYNSLSKDDADRNDPSQLSSYFISNGSYLRRNGTVVSSSLSKVFMYAAKEGKKIHLQLHGEPLIEASLAPGNINSLTVNDKPASIKYDKDHMLLIRIDNTKQ